jgi:ABC-type bacteriocin/lantibiotic exporter with double-glycine peptidase domain
MTRLRNGERFPWKSSIALTLGLSWKLTEIALVFASINFFALQLMLRTRVETNLKLAQEYGKVNGVAIAGIQTLETLKASGLELDSCAKLAEYYSLLFKNTLFCTL